MGFAPTSAPMPTPFDAFGYLEATQTVARANALTNITGFQFAPLARGVATSARVEGAGFGNPTQLIRLMLDGDMWLEGAGWIGPKPSGATEDGFSETMRLLHQGFVSENALAEIVERHVAGVLGLEPKWGLTPRRALANDESPTDPEQTLIDDAEALLTEWWDARKVHKFLHTATRTLLYARRSVIRLYVPRGKLSTENIVDDATGRTKTVKTINASDIPAGLAFVWPDAPLPEASVVAEDPDTKESIGVVLYRSGQNVMGTAGGQDLAEVTYLAEPNAGGTPLTIIRQSVQGGQGGAVRLDFGGRISMYEMTRAPFITPQIIQLQRALNLALSALPRNVITAGWLERVISNAQMPGKWVADTAAPGGKRWVADKHTTGAGVTTYLRGLKQEDAGQGSISYSTPTVNWREPAPVTPTVEAAEAFYRCILREAKQEHVLMSQDVKASGKSREQARSDFEMTLRATTAEVNALGRWLVETALAMAEAFAGSPGKYTTTLRAHFDCEIDTGPITNQERTAIDASVAAGTLSTETAMALEGIADPDAEIARIAAQPGGLIDIITKQAAAILVLFQAGCDIEGAALLVGIDPEIAKKLVPQFTTDPNGPPDPNNPNSPIDPAADPNNPAPKDAPPAKAPAAPAAPPAAATKRSGKGGRHAKGAKGAKPGGAGGASGGGASGNSAGGLPADQGAG